jgi:hypothetical protein
MFTDLNTEILDYCNNLNPYNILTKILLDFKDYNPVVCKTIKENYNNYDNNVAEWWISITDSLCISLSSIIIENNNGSSIITFNDTLDVKCYLLCISINIYYINPEACKYYNANIKTSKGLEIILTELLDSIEPIFTLKQTKMNNKYCNYYDYYTLHNKYFNLNIIIDELKTFVTNFN